MVTMAQSAVNWRTLTWITHIHSHTYINTVRTTLCEAPAQLLHNLGSNFYFKGTWERGSKPEYPEKNPDSLPANRYHIFEEKIQRPLWGSNPHCQTLVISSLGQEREPRLTHWATDCCQLHACTTLAQWSYNSSIDTWCFMPSQTQRVLSGQNKMYSYHKYKFGFITLYLIHIPPLRNGDILGKRSWMRREGRN